MSATAGLVQGGQPELDETAQEGRADRLSWAAAPLSALVAVDFGLGFALVLDRVPLPVVGQPTGVALMCLLILVGTLRRPTHVLRHRGLIVGLFALMMASVVLVTQVSGLDWVQRSAKMVILFLAALTVAVGRVHLRSMLAGATFGLVLNVGFFYAGLTSNNYPPYLTGFLGDKNVAGLFYGVILLAGLAVYRTHHARLLHVVALAVPLALTGSRTSIAAGVAGLTWVLLRNRLPLILRWALAGGIIWALVVAERQFARIGLFADREDTDRFREQILIATELKVANAPWFGEGLTTAWVLLDGRRFMWFHNSYAALRIEGGWVMIMVMAILVAVLGLGLLQRGKVSEPLLYAEGALVVVLVCAWQLGEVFFTTPAFLVLGMAWRLRWGVPTSLAPGNGPGGRDGSGLPEDLTGLVAV